MMTMEEQYLQLMAEVLESGERRTDRTGVGTLSLFGRQLRCDLNEGFPALTTKKLAWRAVVGELLWFLEGSGDERRLAEITHGTRDPSAKTIWTPNAEAPYWADRAQYSGDLGRVYGVQWRSWRSTLVKSAADSVQHADGSVTHFDAKVSVSEIDQIAQLVNTLKNNPTDRRMILSAFNVGELDEMALPPCHMFAQFYVNTAKKTLSCQVYMRSNDLFLGAPFNIASYALLTHMLAQVTGHGVGELIMTIGDAHIYANHVDAVREQLTRVPKQMPRLELDPGILDIDAFNMEDIELVNYTSHASIRAPMAV